MKVLNTFLLGMCVCTSALAQAQSPYISKVFDFCPAPGQFVNELPDYEIGDTHEDMIRKAEECIAENKKIMISLGGYGGYVVFGFDHLIENIPGKYDFRILGNAFYADANPNPDASREGGSCEPGIVMVSYDANGNGLPDDPWYELAGSEYHKPETIKKYRLTYYKPDENKVRTPDPNYRFLNDTSYVKWISNQGDSGYVARNTFHSQPYYPQWINEENLVFEGTKLANNYVDESGTGSYYVQYAYRWGYADNQPNTNDRSCFDITWAVDEEENPVKLPGIHFVKVYTGVNQYCGWLGETSTEVMGAEDLHTLRIDIPVQIYSDQSVVIEDTKTLAQAQAYYSQGTLHLLNLNGSTCSLLSLNGGLVQTFSVHSQYDTYTISLPSGLYILKVQKESLIKEIKVLIL